MRCWRRCIRCILVIWAGFLGRSGRVGSGGVFDGHSDVQVHEESERVKHGVNGNSVKMYDRGNVLRVETTIDNPKEFRSDRAAVGDPEGAADWRVLRRSVADTHRRSVVSESSNGRYLEALSSVAATASLGELAAPWCARAAEPGGSGRKLRALNPLAAGDAALLTAVSDPKWQLNGLRNGDLSEAVFGEPPIDPKDRKRRCSQVGRLLRLLRAHRILRKVSKSNRYVVCGKARDALLTVLAARKANAESLTETADEKRSRDAKKATC